MTRSSKMNCQIVCVNIKIPTLKWLPGSTRQGNTHLEFEPDFPLSIKIVISVSINNDVGVKSFHLGPQVIPHCPTDS